MCGNVASLWDWAPGYVLHNIIAELAGDLVNGNTRVRLKAKKAAVTE